MSAYPPVEDKDKVRILLNLTKYLTGVLIYIRDLPEIQGDKLVKSSIENAIAASDNDLKKIL